MKKFRVSLISRSAQFAPAYFAPEKDSRLRWSQPVKQGRENFINKKNPAKERGFFYIYIEYRILKLENSTELDVVFLRIKTGSCYIGVLVICICVFDTRLKGRLRIKLCTDTQYQTI